MTTETELSPALQAVIDHEQQKERRRCVGIVLKHLGTAKLAGAEGVARVLDAVATELEHGE